MKKAIFLMILSVWLPCFGEDFFSKLSLEEKVGQLLMVHFHGNEVNENAKILVQGVKVGGIIYYNWANGLDSPEQVRTLSQDLQLLNQANSHAAPLLIAVDQEGGTVARLTNGFTKFPSQRALAETQNPELAERMGETVSRELQAVGVNMNLAPVVDVNSNPCNPVIGARSFGEDPEVVSLFGEKILKGFAKNGMIGTLKHFPGHGDTKIDSHLDLPTVSKSQDELEKTELVPFRRLAPLVDAIMTAHILVPALDPNHCSTLSEKTLKYLRDQIGFQGVIVTDSLVMGGVLKTCGTVDEAAIQALQAGCDLLILGGKLLVGEKALLGLTAADIEHVHQSIIQAVKQKRISIERIDEAAKRVLDLKRKHLVF